MEHLAWGAAVLGAGGGGDPYLARTLVLKELAAGGDVRLVGLHELADEAVVVPTAMMGAPTILSEKVPSGEGALRALRTLERELGAKVSATMPIEAGGVNALIPMLVAAQAGIPVVDADGMGRAFPGLHMDTFHIYGVKGAPMALANEQSHSCVVNAADNLALERLARSLTVAMGGTAFIAAYPMTGRQAKETAIPSTLSLGIRLGEALRSARARKQPPAIAVTEVTAQSIYGRAIVVFEGKVTEVQRQRTEGFLKGRAVIARQDDSSDGQLVVEFQNENMVARVGEQVVATVPDIITLLDYEAGSPINTESLKYGYRVTCLAIPTPEIMRTRAALDVWGPRSFGYDLNYVPLEALHSRVYA